MDIPTRLGRLRVNVAGAGAEPIVLWPALLLDHRMWHAQLRHFGERYTVISLDPPGHGSSAPLRSTFTFDDCAGCIADVLDHLELPRAHVFGSAWGAMVGGIFAASYPDRVGCSVLLNGTALASTRMERVKHRVLLGVGRLLGGVRPPLTKAVLDAMLGPTSMGSRPDVVEHVLQAAAGHQVDSLALAVRSVVVQRPDLRERLRGVSSPVLVIAGAEDSTFPAEQTRSISRAIDGAEFVVVDGVAHLAALEAPAEVNRLAGEFLEQHS